MKKREFSAALALLVAASALCLQVMKKVGRRLEKDVPPRPPVNRAPEESADK